MPIRVNENKLQLISPSTKLGFKNMLYKKKRFCLRWTLSSSASLRALNRTAVQVYADADRSGKPMSVRFDAVYRGSDSTDQLILKTNAWRIILNCKLTFRRRYLYNLNKKWSSSSFYCLMATISLGTPSKNSTTSYGIHLKRL